MKSEDQKIEQLEVFDHLISMRFINKIGLVQSATLLTITGLVTYMWPQVQFLTLHAIFLLPQLAALYLHYGFAKSHLPNVRQTRVTQPFACVLTGFSAVYHMLHFGLQKIKGRNFDLPFWCHRMDVGLIAILALSLIISAINFFLWDRYNQTQEENKESDKSK